jgi:Sulfotransferase family
MNEGPVVILSYLYSGAALVQEALSSDARLARTQHTGILPLCAAAAGTWRRVEGGNGQRLSRLALASVRQSVTTQLTVLLTATGKTRWCELAAASADTDAVFRQVFPNAGFVCVHRSCTEVVAAGVAASPWGLHAPAIGPYALAHPGNSVAALAAYWTRSTDVLLQFERANSEAAHRVRYEDVITDPVTALTDVRSSLRLTRDDQRPGAETGAPPASSGEVPVEMIPADLRERIDVLHAELGYPPLT